VADGAEPDRLRAVLVCRHDVHRDVPQGDVLLERVQHRPAVHLRELDVQHHPVDAVAPREHQPLLA
jgi:hypothetical protein